MTCSCRGFLITSDFGHIIYKQVYKEVDGFSWFFCNYINVIGLLLLTQESTS